MAVDIIEMKMPNRVVKKADPMKTMTFKRPRACHFFSDRYAYRERPNYLPELVGFAVIIVTAAWPIVLMASAIATMR